MGKRAEMNGTEEALNRDENITNSVKPLDRYLSPLDVWAMAFGCMVGWGVFAMHIHLYERSVW